MDGYQLEALAKQRFDALHELARQTHTASACRHARVRRTAIRRRAGWALVALGLRLAAGASDA